MLAVIAIATGYFTSGHRHHGSSSNFAPSTVHETVSLRHFQAEMVSSGQIRPMIRGSKVTVVMLMASWCKYCAYDNRYVWPAISRMGSDVQINMVDVSAHGGIGDPGPINPEFMGKDHFGPPLGITGMRRLMQRYVQQFGINEGNIHVFVNPDGMSVWHVTAFPTTLFFDSDGRLLARENGGLTVGQVKSELNHIVYQK